MQSFDLAKVEFFPPLIYEPLFARDRLEAVVDLLLPFNVSYVLFINNIIGCN